MRKLLMLAVCSMWVPAWALSQDAFDACNVFTQADAEKALGAGAAGEPENPKVRRPKVVMSCAYRAALKDGSPVEAKAQFHVARSDGEAHKVFDEQRMRFQSKPMLISGAEAFWSAKVGQLYMRKGRTWVTLSVGPPEFNRREIEPARQLAQALVKKL